MHNPSMRSRAWAGAALLLGIIAVDVLLARQHAWPLSPSALGWELFLPCVYLGWLGIMELRRLGKRQLVREIQIIEVVLLAPVLLGYATQTPGTVLMVLAAVVLLGAFGLGLWHRKAAGDGRSA